MRRRTEVRPVVRLSPPLPSNRYYVATFGTPRCAVLLLWTPESWFEACGPMTDEQHRQAVELLG